MSNRVRVAGSGFTVFTFAGQPISFAEEVSHTSPMPVGPGAVAIHPMDEPYPVQIITPAASGMGQLVLNMYELYGEKVWDRLGAAPGATIGSNPDTGSSNNINTDSGDNLLKGCVDLVDVFIRIAGLKEGECNVVKHVRPPALNGEPRPTPFTEQYHGCVITNITDGESISVGTMEVTKQVTVAYRYMTRNNVTSRAFNLRENPIGKG
jgi:hypothetical protein